MPDTKPLYDDLVQASEGVEVTPVNQDNVYYRGICGGLSAQNILQELKSKKPTVNNPFDNNNVLNASIMTQKVCRDNVYCFNGFLQTEPSIKTSPLKPIHPETFENKLIKTIEHTNKDGQARGVFVALDPHRDPLNGSVIKDGSLHAVSMTTRKKGEELLCTGMDPNSFFAKTNNLLGCRGVAHKLAATADAYDAFDIRLSTSRRLAKT